MKQKARKLLLVSFAQIIVFTVFAQNQYSERTDPLNPKRRIVELRPVMRRLPQTINLRNVLDEDHEKRPTLPIIPFELKNPKSGKAINPDAKIKIKMPDGSERNATVKEFFSQLNELEKKLNQRGRSLRLPNTLAGLRPEVSMMKYKQVPAPPPGFLKGNFEFKKPDNESPSANKAPIKIGKVMTPSNNLVKLADWTADLYISERTPDYGTAEFPVEWTKSSIPSSGRKKIPFVIAATTGMHVLIQKIVWQMSTTPFDNTLNVVNVPDIIKTGTLSPVPWANNLPETHRIPGAASNRFAEMKADLSDIPYPVNEVKAYYIRAVCYNQQGEVLKITPQVIALYGAVNKPFKIAVPERNTVPGFNYSFPESGDIPFGIYIKGSGLNSVKSTKYTDETYEILRTTGYRISADAALGIRYYNFYNLISSSEPKSKELNILRGTFTGVAGVGTGPTGNTEAQGVTLALNILDGAVAPVNYAFTQKLPGINSISLDYNFKQNLDAELLNTRFMIGPVPIKITAGLKGEAGLNLGGQFNNDNFAVTGEIKPYLSTSFYASGGVDAVVAYATLNAEVNPLLNIEMPLTFSSTATKPLSFSTNISGLKGKVYLKAGFYYPCPSLEKIVGFISGDEDLPLCECAWEFNIFDFPGFEYHTGY